jgi:alkylhydroperoxidase family enzyme
MAAFVAENNGCEWCTRAHAAVAEGAYQDGTRVSGVLMDLEAAPIEEPLRVTLRILRKLTREHALNPDDMRAVLAAGISREQIGDALAVCFAFSITARLANTFGFVLASRKAFDAGAKYLLTRGYR